MPRLIPTIIGLFATLLSALWLTGQQSPPDLILVNGTIFTSSSTHPYVEALAIRGERISSVGTSREISSLSGTRTKRIDLGGRVVIPGINDAHYHCDAEPNAFHLQFNNDDPTWREVADQLAAAETKAPKEALILGDIGPTALDDEQATGASLDKLSPRHPVLLRTWSGHAHVVNRLGLAKLGVREDEPDPVGGKFLRSTDGKLTGVAYEYALGPLMKGLDALTSEAEALQQMREFLGGAGRLGITSVQDMSAPVGAERCVGLLDREGPDVDSCARDTDGGKFRERPRQEGGTITSAKSSTPDYGKRHEMGSRRQSHREFCGHAETLCRPPQQFGLAGLRREGNGGDAARVARKR
jgi:hypothetical protein